MRTVMELTALSLILTAAALAECIPACIALTAAAGMLMLISEKMKSPRRRQPDTGKKKNYHF